MKNLIKKVRHHGKKITVHLKRHHRKYLFGVLCSGILALIAVHTANTINNIFADEEHRIPDIIYNSDAKITYIDTNGREFTDIGTITINDGTNSITMLDRNLGAITNDIEDTGSYGYHFQWGNNFGFEIGCLESPCTDYIADSSKNWNDAMVDASDYGLGRFYVGDIFITDRSDENNGDWSLETNDTLWGGEKDNIDSKRGLDLGKQLNRQGPCPDGFHIPSIGEWNELLELWLPTATYEGDMEKEYSEDKLFYILTNDDGLRINFQKDFKIPSAGYRNFYDGKILDIGSSAQLRSSSPNSDKVTEWGVSPKYARYFSADKYGIISHRSTSRANAFSLRCFKNIPPTCNIRYSTTQPTNQNVVATLTCNKDVTVTNNGGNLEYTFENTGTFLFEYDDLEGNTGSIEAKVTWIDKQAPNCEVAYSTMGLTNQNVTATLSCDEEDITVTNNSGNMEYTFENTGTFLFEFQDLAGNTGSIEAEVTWIDKQAPNCEVTYSTTGLTNQNVTATLSCDEEDITVTNNSGNMEYTFENTGTFLFEFQDLAGNTGSIEAEVTWIDKQAPGCEVQFRLINLDTFIAYITGCNEKIYQIDENMPLTYIFNHNGNHEFWFSDEAGNIGKRNINISGFENSINPQANNLSSISHTMKDNVITVSWETTDSGWLEVFLWDENDNRFKYLQGVELDSKVFAFPADKARSLILKLVPNGNSSAGINYSMYLTSLGTGFKLVPVSIPNCSINYSTESTTNSGVIAYLTGCNENVSGNGSSHLFSENGSFMFIYKNSLNNYWYTAASVNWIISGDNTTYFDIEGNEFRWNDLTICNPDNSRECITMMDRNLGATTNNISRTGSYGYYYQWGNNYGFSPNLESLRTGENPVDASSYGPGNYYNSGVYTILPRNEAYARDRSTVRNDNLRGGSGDDMDNNYLGYFVQNPIDRQGPCPDGYHVPSMGERFKVMEWRALSYSGAGYGNIVYPNNWGRPALSGGISRFRSDFFIPESKSFYTNRYEYEDFYDIIQESLNFLQTSSPIPYTSGDYTEFGFFPHNTDNRSSRNLLLDNVISISNSAERGLAAPVRCFKNNTGYLSVDSGISFSVSVDGNINAGKYVDFTVKVIKGGQTYKDYTNMIMIVLTDKEGNLIDEDLYDVYNNGIYEFTQSDKGKKTFKNGLRIKKAGTYRIEIFDLDDNEGFETIVAKGGHSSAAMEFDTLKFNPYYSNEMNKAYQYSRYYDITTKDNIKEANMYGGLDRVAMAKMLANYAENVLGIDNFDTSRNCKFVDVPASLDRDYGYGITKACQLGIMGVNMQNNKFRPYDSVSRAEFATALSRLLYGTKDGADKYYSTHISKLYKEGIISNTDPNLKELRGYVMLMLMRSDEDYVPEEIEYPATYSVNKIDTTVRTIYTEGCNWYTITQNPHGNNTYMPNKNWTDDIKFVNKALQDVRDNGEHLVKNYIDEANRVLDSAGLTKRDQCKYSLLIDELEHQDGAIKSYKNENGKITIGIDFISYKENITWDDYDDWNGRDLKKNTSTKLRYYTVSDNAEFETINVDNNGVLGTNYTKFIHNRDTRLNNFCNNEPIYYHIDDEELQYIAGYQKFGTYFNGGRYYNHNGGDKDRYCIKRQIESGGTSGRFAFDSKGQVNKIMKGYYFDCVWCS